MADSTGRALTQEGGSVRTPLHREVHQLLTFDEYQETIRQFDVSNGERWYYALGLAGEVGECVEKVKKFYRDGVENVEAVRFELGDALWYLGRLADKYNIRLSDVATGNVEKLTARARTNTLHGSGDERHLAAATDVGGPYLG